MHPTHKLFTTSLKASAQKPVYGLFFFLSFAVNSSAFNHEKSSTYIVAVSAGSYCYLLWATNRRFWFFLRSSKLRWRPCQRKVFSFQFRGAGRADHLS